MLMSGTPPGPLVAVAPYTAEAMSAVSAAVGSGAPRAYLVGNRCRISDAAGRAALASPAIEICEADDYPAAVARAADLVRKGEAEFVVKGSLPTADLLRGLLGRSALGAGRCASHIYVLEAAAFSARPVAVTDAGVNLAPSLEVKAAIVGNACAVLRQLGVDQPRVAALSAVETVNPALPSTGDAAALAAMASRGHLGRVRLDEPLSLDAALTPRAARNKGLSGEVAGRADVLLAPSLDAANILAKALIGDHGRAMGVVVGASVPIALPSRGDSLETRINSTMLAGFLAQRAARPVTPPMPTR